MFSFFSKKEFLADHLEGFVDIHNHILSGIDDGAKTLEESIALVKGFGEFGVTDFICTPHIMENYYPNTSDSINKASEKLKKGLTENKLDTIKIEVAAEHMIDAGFENLLEKNDVMPLSNNYLLVEMSYLQASINFDQAIDKIKQKGYFPILAHPERYVYFHNNLRELKRIKEKGILFQMNILSLSDYYGATVQKMAHRLLEENLIDFMASDVHNLRQLEALKKLTLGQKKIGLVKPIVQKTIYNFTV